MNKIANWLREVSTSDDVEKIISRCNVAAGEIERLEHAEYRTIQTGLLVF